MIFDKIHKPKWLLSMPLLHFLMKRSEPNVLLKPDRHHESAFWWGIQDIAKDKRQFAFDSKEAIVSQYMEWLGPLFSVDYLLPRTLLSGMCVEDMERLVQGHHRFRIPPDASLAWCCKFIRSSKESEILGNHKKIVIILKNILSRSSLDENIRSLTVDQLAVKRAESKSQFEFACDVLNLLSSRLAMNKEKEKHSVVMSTVKVAARAISNMWSLQSAHNERIHQSAVDNNVVKDLKELQGLVTNWLWNTLSVQFEHDCPAYEVEKQVPASAMHQSAREKILAKSKQELDIYRDLFDTEQQFDRQELHLIGLWNDFVKNFIASRLDTVSARDRVMIFCNADVNCMNLKIEECFNAAAFRALEDSNLTEREDMMFLCESLHTDPRIEKIHDLQSSMFMGVWCKDTMDKGDDSYELTIQHILTWPYFARFIELSQESHNGVAVLNDDCREHIDLAIARFQHFVGQLHSAEITAFLLDFVICHKDSFIHIAQTTEKCFKSEKTPPSEAALDTSDISTSLHNILKRRQREIEAFRQNTSWIENFISMCSNISSNDIGTLRTKLDYDPRTLRILDMCQPMIYDEAGKPCIDLTGKKPCSDDDDVTIIYYRITIYEPLKLLGDLRDSIVFKQFWNLAAQRAQSSEPGSSLPLTVILESVVEPAIREWNALSALVRSGEATLIKVDQVTDIFIDEQPESLLKELVLMCAGDKLAGQRLEQVKMYHQLERLSTGAQRMQTFRTQFLLTGDFGAVDSLMHVVADKQQTLSRITPKLVESSAALGDLADITEQKIKCLNAFLEHKGFCDWLRLIERKEVKALVDLALISTEGQDALEVQKITCLGAAAAGYAPLIYDLKSTDGFVEVMDHCKLVWLKLDEDRELTKKFTDTAGKLEWLNRVKESHGTVELNALSNVAAINAGGVYTVGGPPEPGMDEGNGQRKSLETVVRLKLLLDKNIREVRTESLRVGVNQGGGGESGSGGEVKKRWQTLSLKELHDLQSTLMLVAGRAQDGKKDVDRFVQMLDGVTRLASVYVEICAAGCVLFQHWKAIFYCDSARPMFARVELSKDSRHVIDGTRSGSGGSVQDYIVALSTFLEECLAEWRQHIAAQRAERYYLNHYTTEQLVILQTELAKLNTDAKWTISPLVYPLLATIHPSCSLHDLETAMKQTPIRLAEEEDQRKKERERDASKFTLDADLDQIIAQKQKEEKEKFMDELLGSYDNKELVEKAWKSCGPDIEKGMDWCYDHMDDPTEEVEGSAVDDELQLSESSSDFKIGTTQEGATVELLKNIMNSVSSEDTLYEQLRKVWIDYRAEMNKSVGDYLSVRHLGVFLECLDQMDTTRLNRPIAPFLMKGKPNLLICSQAEVLPLVLMLYEIGSDLPMPGVDEVLLCNSATSAEDVELLWRRAAGDANTQRKGKLYALVHAELLDYNVARSVEQSLALHCLAARDNIRVAVVCCRGGAADHSFIVSALERYIVRLPPLDLEKVRLYVQRHLSAAASQVDCRPASNLDPERCMVRVIKSHRAGVGKTLKVQRLHEELLKWPMLPGAASLPRAQESALTREGLGRLVSLRLQSRVVDESAALHALLQHTLSPGQHQPRIFHIDVAHEVEDGVDHLLFNLLILSSLTDREGFVWRRSPLDLYLVETLPLMQRSGGSAGLQYRHSILDLLPFITCWSPSDSLALIEGRMKDIEARYENPTWSQFDQRMDDLIFKSSMFQRPFQYLLNFRDNKELRGIKCTQIKGDHQQCIKLLLSRCGIDDPSWAELHHFANFLDIQLSACETSIFCSEAMSRDLPGFLKFVVRFMIHMSKDFATRSLVISEQTPNVAQTRNRDDSTEVELLKLYSLNRRWERSAHPYLFFNEDRVTFTFMGFKIDPGNGNLVSSSTGEVLDFNVMQKELIQALIGNRVNLAETFDSLSRQQKIDKMCSVMGVKAAHDPDPTYELTTDNVTKMLAIYMRFRCGIPVIIMGETGCGKTQLIRFMAALWKPLGSALKNMVLMKMHGGTTTRDIERKVTEAMALAGENSKQDVQTVLFFDETNTTEAIGLIKEIMCDHTMNGRPVQLDHGLRLIAACNPYRKHSDAMIAKMEKIGLGYYKKADQTLDRLGRIPMRHLVYRVQALPQSMLPLVWDFGQLDAETEAAYIKQMVRRHVQVIVSDAAAATKYEQTISDILAASQAFMRQQQDECSFVSLRDVDRALCVMRWFYSLRASLNPKMDELAKSGTHVGLNQGVDGAVKDADVDGACYEASDDLARALVLALGACYHCSLQKREEYRVCIAKRFVGRMSLQNGPDTIKDTISRCEDVFLAEVELGVNIARNQALKENLFMMIVCIELRIPLFLVGKPGSSKSLSRTIVADAMQGADSRTQLFKTLKSVQIISFQCSPLSTPEGIVATFRQCAALQSRQDLTKFVSVVVLEEIGLAEESEKMPLKALHPLLEDGCEGDEDPAPHQKVAFIGISNWSLDPAKMNRGILVQRGVPDELELVQSARGMCMNDEAVAIRIESLMKPMSRAYLELYNSTLKSREYFGLRDFYSLIKMTCGFAKKSGATPTWHELQHAILRNFGGISKLHPDLKDIHPLEVFDAHLRGQWKPEQKAASDPESHPAALIRASLQGVGLDSESRYLLILTQNYEALSVLQNELLMIENAIVIFGSCFPRDQVYTQVCRNINRIKVCMETGCTVVLLNLESLYESLYDALNQYYMMFGGQRFIDLGLGTHRVKCRVHKDFRLIVVAERDIVHDKFPIPLINRLEKHFLDMTTMLTEEEFEVANRLHTWCTFFAGSVSRGVHRDRICLSVSDVFIGYHKDTAASVVVQVRQAQRLRMATAAEKSLYYLHAGTVADASDTGNPSLRHHHPNSTAEPDKQALHEMDRVLDEAKDILLCCATPESVVRLSETSLASVRGELQHRYFKHQHHNNLLDFIKGKLVDERPKQSICVQVTTHSRLLPRHKSMTDQVSKVLKVSPRLVALHAILSFSTAEQFCKMLREFSAQKTEGPRVLFLQCDAGNVHTDLIACVRYHVTNELNEIGTEQSPLCITHVILIVQLPRVVGGCFVSFQGGRWLSYHIDDLHTDENRMPSFDILIDKPVGELFEAAASSCKDRLAGAGARSSDNAKGDDDQEEVAALTSHGTTEADSLDVREIIRSCVHSATALITDTGEALMQRKTRRLDLLLQQLDSDDTEGLVPILLNRIAALLRDKEKNAMNPDVARNWLIQEASSCKAIYRAGTFQRAVWLNFQSKIVPPMAVIIAFVDTNSNFDLLVNEVSGGDRENLSWMARMWISMLSNVNLTAIKYQDVQQIVDGGHLKELQVRSTGFGGRHFQAKLPFSWVIKERVDLIMQQAKPQWMGDTEAVVVRLLADSPLGRILEEASREAGIKKVQLGVAERYLHDFVCMVYKPLSVEPELQQLELALVAADIKNLISCRYILRGKEELEGTKTKVHSEDQTSEGVESNRDKGDPHILKGVSERSASQSGDEKQAEGQQEVLTIPRIHVTFDEIHGRVQLFAQLVQEWPECVKLLNASNNPNPSPNPSPNSNSYPNPDPNPGPKPSQQSPLDLHALWLLMDSMKPEMNALNNIETRELWVARVQRFGPLVSRLLQSVSVSSEDAANAELRHSARCAWNRVCALQLFIEHVCAKGSKEEQESVKRCMPLWTQLRGATDFKSVKFLSVVDKFLVKWNKIVVQTYSGVMEKCPACLHESGPPVTLPCADVICRPCFEQLKTVDSCFCPIDQQPFPIDMMPKETPDEADAVLKYNQYKQRCNSFYMDLVSRLCLTGDAPPEPGVVQRLMTYVTKSSPGRAGSWTMVGKLALFNEGFDPTPVVRSFFLQLLLRSNMIDVRQHLVEYFDKARDVLMSNADQVVELYVLCVQCFEDHYFSLSSQAQSTAERINFTHGVLQGVNKTILDGCVTMERLEWVAKARYGLCEAADWIHKLHGHSSVAAALTGLVADLIAEAKRLCDHLEWARLFLVKQLGRRYGQIRLMELLHEATDIAWIAPHNDTSQSEQLPDRYVFLGDRYMKKRELIANAMQQNNTACLADMLEELRGSDDDEKRQIFLALYRSVTATYAHKDASTNPSREALEKLSQGFKGVMSVEEMEFVEHLLYNRLDLDRLKLTSSHALADLALVELIVHLKVVLRSAASNSILRPLAALASEPLSMNQAFLPTMPHDPFMEIKQATIESTTRDPNSKFYQCPKGHPYVVVDCGRPWVEGQCRYPQCGASIGGKAHKLADGNVLFNRADTTKPGHVLGAPRRWIAEPDRNMSPASLAVLRVLLHMAMYLGCTQHLSAIAKLIDPAVCDNNVQDFLWQHIQYDVEAIQTALDQSPDDVLITLQLILDEAFRSQAVEIVGLNLKLDTKEARSAWEVVFVNRIISRLLGSITDRLQIANAQIVTDSHLGNSLLRMMYEVEESSAVIQQKQCMVETVQQQQKQQAEVQQQQLPKVQQQQAEVQQLQQAEVHQPHDEAQEQHTAVHEQAAVWRFRHRITLEHMSNALSESVVRAEPGNAQCILQLFLQHERQLRALRLLPSVVRLQQTLVLRYNRTLDYADITKFSFTDVLQDAEQSTQEEYKRLFNDFAEAWDCVRSKLKLEGYVFNGYMLPKGLAPERIDEGTSVGVLMPSLRGPGLCAVVLLYYLCQLQNNFMEQYSTLTKQPLETRVCVQDANSSHLVAYHPDHDLLPVILANCNYSLGAGQGTKVTYDFAEIERQVVDRFIRGRPRLDFDITCIAFRGDFTSVSAFTELRKAISQQPLVSRMEITRALNQKLPEVNDMLASLNIVIGFLVSVDGDPNLPIHRFMGETLKMKNPPLINVIDKCCLKHVEALWLLLSFLKARMQVNYGQEAFEDVEDKYREALPAESVKRVKDALTHVHNLEEFAALLHECIVMCLTVRQDPNVEDYVDNIDHALKCTLQEYLTAKDLEARFPVLSDSRFPVEICVKHCIDTWKIVIEQMKT